MKTFYTFFGVVLVFLLQVAAYAQQNDSRIAGAGSSRQMLSATALNNGSAAAASMGKRDPKGAGTIRGYVRDAKTNSALPGATVLLKGTGLGASTDLNGNYFIANVPAGSYTIRVSYLGYHSREQAVTVEAGATIAFNAKLQPVGVRGKEVVVTAQASGQNSAINQQLSSKNIVSVVSAARIRELPDANAAESVGRLPGVSVIRSGGEGTSIVIRGLAPQYNEIMIDGVEMAPTDAGDRGTNLSMISSDMLDGIEVYKTVTPDMDAAALGGVVNFTIREARTSPTGGPLIGLLAQGGYDNLQNTYNDYKFVGSVEDRFLNKRLGIFAQGIVERANHTSDVLGGSYYIVNKLKPDVTALSGLNLAYDPREEQRYDGTLVMDYRLPNGKIELMNFFSSGNTRTENRSQNYSLQGNSITYGLGLSSTTLNVVTNLLHFEQHVASIDVDARLSQSFSENNAPYDWSVNFAQSGAGTGSIPSEQSPVLIAQDAATKVDLSQMFLNIVSISQSYNKQRNLTGALDLQRTFSLSDLVSATFKAGGSYMYTNRYYDVNTGSGYLDYPVDTEARKTLMSDFPWLAESPYNINTDGTQNFPITAFLDPGFDYGKVFNGDYAMGPATNIGILSQLVDKVKQWGEGQTTPIGGLGGSPYVPSFVGSLESDYSGNEYRSAGYVMATLKIGPAITLIPGVRYQGLLTSYRAPRFYNASAPNPYPNTIPYQDTTMTEYHGFWLPDVILSYRPLSWLNMHAAYTNTISYPGFSSITPRLDVNATSIIWNNYALNPAHSQNYDLQFSFFNNAVGLFTAGAFLKQIDNMIFSEGVYVTDPSVFPGIPGNSQGYSVSTSINNPYRVNVWGMEYSWQTHFWYLPDPLQGLVLNINYTHIFSGAKYPYTYSTNSGFPNYLPVYVDTFYTDRLIDQPNDVVNLSVGYDYRGFSARASMIYQSNVFNGTAFYNVLRSEKVRYLRWDFSAKQNLWLPGFEIYLDLNDLNNENDVYVIRGPGFPASAQDYGMTADLGLRWRLE